MKFTLKDYQRDAVGSVLVNLRKAGKRWHEDGERSSFALSATTGAGKTVMAAAVFEALFHGDDDFDFAADPTAVVVWFSDDPALNEQSRHRLLEASDRINRSDLVVVDNSFKHEKLSAGKVYFLNSQKLGKNSLLTRGAGGDDGLPDIRPDDRAFTIWETLQNTIEDSDLTLYLVLDEAHRGMGATKKTVREKSTIVKRLIDGNGVVDPIPVVWGISATIERFQDAMAGAPGRTQLPDVQVDSLLVQESGLLKDTVALDIPDEVGAFDTVLVRRATEKMKAATAEWSEYTTDQGLEPVVPLMVFQVPNTPDPDEIGRALNTMLDEWPDLSTDAIAHVFGEHTTQEFGNLSVPYISPERVQDSDWIRVLVAKDAISTGWDCPRAEVMVSFRPAVDKTHITQLLGRMVRSPLARRIPGNDRLNAVDCLLPFFDTKTVSAVADLLMTGKDSSDGETPPVRRVLINPIEVTPNRVIDDDVWDKFLSLPSQSVPQRHAKPVKRLTAVAHELAFDGLLADAGKRAHAEMHKVLDAAQSRYKTELAAARDDVLTVEGKTLTANLKTKEKTFNDFVADADYAVIEDAYRRAVQVLSPDVARTYAEYLADQDSEADDDIEALMNAHTTIAALGLIAEVKEYLDDEADKLAAKWFDTYRVKIKGQSDERQDVYRQIKELSTDPQDVDLAKPHSWMVATTALEGEKETTLPTYTDHLLCAPDGTFPYDVDSSWETDVLDIEKTRSGFVGWYRNPGRSSQDSLGIVYEQGDRTRTLRPDFIFFTKDGSGKVAASIIDPHGYQYDDALPKLRGLAVYAEKNASHFQRIEAVAKVGDSLRVLDLTAATVRKAVAAATDAKGLYEGSAAASYG